MGEDLFAETKRYVGFGPSDAACLVALRPLAAPQFSRIAAAFYDRIREHEDAHVVFADEEQITRLQHAMERWLARILSGVYDAAYEAETSKIGRMHVRVGLPQRYMFTAMALLRIELLRIVDIQVEAGAREATREAVCKILDLELGLMLESYGDALLERIERSRVQQDQDRFVLSERRYSAAIELARVAVVGLDRAGAIVFFNRNAEELAGFSRDEVLGRGFVDMFIVEDARSIFTAALARAGDGTNETLDAPLRCRQGRLREVEWQVALAPGGEVDGAVAFAMGRDRTDERALAERTLRNEKLAAIGTLAAGLAHEIRNPLNGAQLHVAFLERSLTKMNAADEVKDAVAVVGAEIHRLADLVTEFLDFARPKPLNVREVTAQGLIERIEQLTHDVAEHKSVKVTKDVPAKELVFQGDGPKLEQVLLNLVQNGIEAVEGQGGGTVSIRARRHPRSVVFEVEDDGPGLTTSDAPIFDAFYSTKPNGTGLGLAITHRIVTDHGGSVTVESRQGRTVFRVSLPLNVSPETSYVL